MLTKRTDAEAWGDLVAKMYTPHKKEAMWATALETASMLNTFVPSEFARPAEWTGSDGVKWHALISGLLNSGGDIAQVRERAESFPRAFGEWRLAVSNHEAANAAKLQVLMSAIKTCALFAGSPDHDGAERMERHLRDHVHQKWGVREIPDFGNYRDWCSSVTRDYRNLPKAWRYV